MPWFGLTNNVVGGRWGKNFSCKRIIGPQKQLNMHKNYKKYSKIDVLKPCLCFYSCNNVFSSLKEILGYIQWWELHCRCQQRAHGPLYKICSGICYFRELLLAPLSSQREQSCTDLVMLVVTNLCYSCNPSFCITSAGLVVHFFKRCAAVFSVTSMQRAAHTLDMGALLQSATQSLSLCWPA